VRPDRGPLRAAVVLLVVAVAGGCGYTLRGNLPGHLRTVAVPVFANRTQEPVVENLITSAVVEAFTTNGRLRVVTAGQADAILDGEIVGYELQPLAFDPRANVRQYRVVVTLNLRFRDARSGEILFEERGLQEKADFTVAGLVATTIGREEAALRQAAIDIGRSIVNLAVDRF
jgi:outer membrane lipopolysaccharide assembly protein LptE/RlpB